jgi:membrane associated rhomboid family serine protease
VLPLRDHLPTRTFPFVNYALIAANVAGFVLEWLRIASGTEPANLLFAYGLVPAHILHDPAGAWPTVFTSMFMHDPTSIMHLGGNMLYLWIFGDNVEDALGHVRYLLFYVLAGVAAATAQTLIDPTSLVPMVGASGAIAGVLAAYAFLYPRSPITVLNPVFILWFFFGIFLTFPAWIVIGLFFVYNLWYAVTQSAQGGVAFAAHVGGFVAGVIMLRLFMLGRVRVDDYARWDRWAQRRRRA